MMASSSKGAPPPPTAAAATSQPPEADHVECCMCGDLGLSSELFRCKICQFRSQHRYCSNIYPKMEPNSVCNWCLNVKEDTAINSFNSSSSNKNSTTTTSDHQDDQVMIKSRKKIGSSAGNCNNNTKGTTDHQKGSTSLKVNVNNYSIKKQKSSSPERSPVIAARKRITTATGTGNGTGSAMMKENLRRTKSDIPKTTKSVIYKHNFRNKVRRYKLLDEVSS